MAVESPSNLNDFPDDEIPPPPIPPLSDYFPELTEDEARLIDGETAKIVERRARVMSMYRRGLFMSDIAKELKCGVGTIHRDIHTVLDGYKRLSLKSAREHIADMLQRLAHREAQIEADLERSRGEQVETTTGRRTTTAGVNNDQAVVKKKQKYGDPKLHALLQGYWDRRCKLLGLLNQHDLGKEGLPPVKLIAGVDPAEILAQGAQALAEGRGDEG